ncbi:HD domain-containing phosphohydrolase [Amphritea japonica]|nr:HD domain-containing phosphohydrolase [Amphritea japonica]
MDYADRSILLVDDEKAVLNSLKRLLRPLRCRVMTAESAEDGLALLGQQPVDLVISDMRMPEMSGEVFLQKVAERWPEIERIVMTGFSDTQSTIDAINKGKISRFLMKPWQDEDVLKVVKKGFELAQLREQNAVLQQLTEKKKKELEALNTELEDKVKLRTEQLEASHLKLISNYRSMVRMFSAITARRLGQDSHKGVQLNSLLIRTARLTPLTGKALKQLYYAWQLRNIGKLSFADELIQQPYVTLAANKQRQFQQHPLRAQAATVLVAPLFPAGEIIVQHKEYLDGSGYPKGLKGEQISYSAQLLCVVNDYVELISGHYQKRPYSSHEAFSYLKEFAAERYNADIVELLGTVIDQLVAEGEVTHEQCLTTSALVPGMVLSRDLLTIQDVLLLGAGQMLDSSAIARLSEMELNLEEQFEVFVRQEVD